MLMTKKGFIFFVVLILIFLSLVIVKNNKQRVEPGKTTAKGKLVEGFPQIPTYPGSRVLNSYKKEGDGKVGYEAHYFTDQPAKEAIIWYRDELNKLGWSIYDEQIEGIVGEFGIMAEKDKQKVNVFVDNEDEGAEISVEFPMQ